MIEQARLLQAEKGLSNVTWEIGDASPLPYNDSSFSLVVTRYSFHHFLDPRSALKEMKRVCAPGGRVAVIDVTPPGGKADAYNRMEKLRDPSHARAMPLAELQGMMEEEAGLTDLETGFYKMDVDLERILQASLTKPEDAEKVRQLFADDLTTDSLGVGSYLKEGKIRFAFPITIIVGRKKKSA
jgi:ubiquinone/menaquinone biosynthesis C-methylase UbiE